MGTTDPTSLPMSELIKEIVASGVHPRDIRRRFQQHGIRWGYSIKGQGKRETARRLKQLAVQVPQERQVLQ